VREFKETGKNQVVIF